jgi:hypothetical protein
MPTTRTQIINLSFHITPAVTPVDATGHAAIHNVARNPKYFPPKKLRQKETSTQTRFQL